MPEFDGEALRRDLEVRAEVALRKAGEFALGRAKHHAPVRALYKRSRRGRAFTQKGPITTASAYKKFRKSKERRRRIDVQDSVDTSKDALAKAGDTKASDVQALQGFAGAQQQGGVRSKGGTTVDPKTGRGITDVGRPRVREHQTDGSKGPLHAQVIGREPKQYGRSTSFSGHSNSLVPVFRKGQYNFTADVRKVGPVGPGLRQHKDSFEGAPTQVRSAQTTASVKKNQMTSRGRYEVKRARRGSKNSGLFQGRVGGRLRGEIHLTPVRRRGSVLWIYVVSPTEYAHFQEFGSPGGRSRAHPYLRPALYESRKVLRSSVQRLATTAAGASSPVTPGKPGPEGGGSSLL